MLVAVAAMTMPVVTELRSAVRFPLRLPVSLFMDGREEQAETENISAAGVLLRSKSAAPLGSMIRFNMCMPSFLLGTPKDVLVNCIGRVVRCSSTGEGSCAIAAIIEEYCFSR